MVVPVLAVAGAVISTAMALAFSIPPSHRKIIYELNQRFPNAIPEISTLIELRWRGKISEEEYLENMKKYGLNENWAKKMYWNAERYLGIADAIALWRRGEISDEDLTKEALKQGIPENRLNLFLKATEFIPGISDIIRFAVREAFNEEIVRKWEYDKDIPPDYIEWAKKLGMSEYWAKMDWRAHWELPSITLALEMFHRLHPDYEKEYPVSEEDIMNILKFQDVLPYWRPRILKISYNLPTRVDVRRFVRYGFIEPEEALKIYRQMGYTKEHAEWLVKLALYEKNLEMIDLTKTQIRDAYLKGLIEPEEAENMLKQLGFSEEEAKLLIDLWYADFREKWVKEYAELYIKSYALGVITDAELNDLLDSLNLSSMEKELYMHLAEVEKAKQMLKEIEESSGGGESGGTEG